MYGDRKRRQTINEPGERDRIHAKQAKLFCKRMATYVAKVTLSASQELASSSDLQSLSGVGFQQKHFDAPTNDLTFETFSRDWKLPGVSDLAISLVYNLLQQ
jgi:hypothetical protein